MSSLRLLALGAGICASIAGSLVSLAHGYAHHEAAEHAAHHDVGLDTDQLTIGGDDHDEGHAHPSLGQWTFTRSVKQLQAAIAAQPVTITFADVAARETRDAPVPNESPPDPPGVSPAHSRAPPTL